MEFPYSLVTKSAPETAKAGEELGRAIVKPEKATVVCLYGELGSGKTTFTQGFAKGLDITHRLLSPTFIIVRRYEIPRIARWFYHVDLYRVNLQKEIDGLGLAEILADPSATVVVEWAEKLGNLLPQKRIEVRFERQEERIHQIWISSHGQSKP